MPAWTALAQGLIAPGAIAMLFFKADSVLSPAASKALTEAIQEVTGKPRESRWPAAITELLAEYFPPKGNPVKFWLSVFVVSILSLVFFLAIYASRTTGLIDQIFAQRVLRQLIGNGLLITLAINAFAYSQYRHLLASFTEASLARNVAWIVADLLAKAILFVVLTAVIYALFAVLFGSFGGDPMLAVSRVPITLREALLFKNLTSVYIYSLLLSSFPIFVAVTLKLLVLSPGFAAVAQKVLFFFPIADKPIRAAAIVFAVFAAAFSLGMMVLLNPLLMLTR